MVTPCSFAKVVRLVFVATLATFPFACGSQDGEGGGGRGPSSGGGDGTGGIIDVSTGGNPNLDPDVIGKPPTPNCGDGKRDEDEACDDGNRESGDGCGGNCRYIEPGYICPEPGEPCRRFAKCGDGVVVPPEQCDDGNLDEGDGCSPTCKVEIGFKCAGSPSECDRTVCGDGLVEGSETCDDGNDVPFDGCSELCQAEPSCTAEGCTSRCGDGLVMGDEECDDGNTLDGDGCSANCTIELGYNCEQAQPCEMIGDDCALRLPIIYRDFSQSHSDFQVSCGTHVKGIARPNLTAAGKPELVASPPSDICIASANSFAEWYGAREGNYSTIVDSIVLFPNGSGGYVNRMDNEGTRYSRPPPDPGIQWCSNESDNCAACPAGYTVCYPTCTPWGNTQTCAQYPSTEEPVYIDGNPLFFPIDDHPDALPAVAGERSVGAIPGPIYGGNWNDDPSGKLRNFHFTSEIAYWFKYDASASVNLTFIGDDDVWVYVNRRLAVDLGGLHEPIEGTFSIANGTITMISDGEESEASAASFGLTDGGVYEIKVFHAERKKTGSSFKLTLSGFNTSRSECLPKCGDGVIAAGEECDDGEELNVGGYNRCNPDCTLSGYCGDGIVQEGEECDDAAPNAPPTCKGCKNIVVR